MLDRSCYPADVDLGLGGRAAIITGASRGIGRCVALTLAEEGAHVLLVARGSDALNQTVDEVRRAGGNAVAMAADVTDPSTAALLVERCVSEFGRLDILVNNAGGGGAKPMAELTNDDWHREFELNFFAAARLSAACAEIMCSAGWGRLIHISSTSGRRPDVLFAPYSAAKAALANLSVALSVELAPAGVLSNCVIVGVTETELVHDIATATAERTGTTEDSVMARMLARTAPPTGRFGTPSEIAAAVVFLASEQAGWITGATLAVDGGTLRSI